MPTPKPAPQKDGTIRYRVRFRDARDRSCSRTFFTKEDAKDFCGWIDKHGPTGALKLLATANEQLTGETDADTTPYLSNVAEEFFEWKKSYIRAERTVAEYRTAYEAHIKPTFGHLRIGSITPTDVDRWVEDMVTGKIQRGTRAKNPDPNKIRYMAPKTIRGRHALLHSILDYAASPRRGYIEANPCRGAELPKKLTPTPKGLMPAQWQAIHANLIVAGEQDAADLAAFLIGSGWRAGEATALTMANVEDYGQQAPMWVTMSSVTRRNSDGSYIVAEADGKAQKSMRRIKLDPDTADIVRRRIQGKGHRDFVFTHNGQQWAYHNFRNRFHKACVTAGLDNATVHWLRHTHVAWLAMSGAPLPELQKRIGHADITTTIGVYGSLIGDVGDDTLSAFTAMRDSAPKVAPKQAPQTIESTTA